MTTIGSGNHSPAEASSPPRSHDPSAGLLSSGIPGHERPVPPSDFAPPTETAGPKLIAAFAFAQLGLFIALLGPVTISMAIKVTAIVGDAQAPTAQGIVLGSPFRAEIERRDPSALERAVDAVTEALLPWDGKDATMSAHVVTATP